MERLGKYELERRLATGGMAQIYLARQSGPGGFEKTVVIKRLFQNLAETEDLVQMFLQEARIAAHLNHPNCVQIYDLGEENGQYFIAMEYIEGPDLMAIQRRARRLDRPIPLPLVTYIMALACRGLHHAHELRDASGEKLGLVHRDVSPHNVLVTYNGDVKLVDFGVAKATTHAAATRAGVLKGKFAYMSPEHCEGTPLDARADVFSAGILLYELLTQRHLFRRDTDFATMRAVMEEHVPLPSEFTKELPPSLDEATIKALHRNRDERYQNAQELQLALEATIRACDWHVGPMQVSDYLNEIFPEHDTPYGKNGATEEPRRAKARSVVHGPKDLLEEALSPLDEVTPEEEDDFDAPTVAVKTSQADLETDTIPLRGSAPPQTTGFDGADFDAATVATETTETTETEEVTSGVHSPGTSEVGDERITQEVDPVFFEDEHTLETAARDEDVALSSDMWSATPLPSIPTPSEPDSKPLYGFELPSGPLESMLSDPMLSDPMLSDPMLSDPMLSDPMLSDPMGSLQPPED
ncbi:MAG: protein kinase, partial [Deltaproteobacteria bacterium]|nr:protein kinase [Deltaproteobacteria bacterium]